MIRCLLITLIVTMSLSIAVTPAKAMDINRSPELQLILDKLVSQHGFSMAELKHWFARVQIRQPVVKAASKPREKDPWHRYKKLFVNNARTRDGVKFYKRHQSELQQTQDRYGVDRFIILAILGIETRYGKQKGRYPVLDSLTTQIIHNPGRNKFYSSELVEFLLLCREEGWNPNAIKGSYAGAMGIPQFISSSYRNFAVDFGRDNQRDLINQNDDAIASVANYLARHGWQSQGRLVSAVVEPSAVLERYATTVLKPLHRVDKLISEGVAVEGDPNSKVSVIKLNTEKQDQFRIAHKNFYVITRYNHSIHYAMAVIELANRLRMLVLTS